MDFGALPAWYLWSVALLFGAFWGSFCNVAIHRIPAGLSIAWPPSRCPSCGHGVRPRDNVPVLSWLLLGRRCRDCLTPISARYPVVELLVAALSLALALRSHDLTGYAVFFAFALLLVILSFIDLDWWLLPDVITLPGIACGVLAALLHPVTPYGTVVTPLGAVIGAAAGSGAIYATALLFRVATGKVGLGGGDVKLMGMVGAFLGYEAVLPVIFLSAAQGSIAGLVLLMFRRREPAAAATAPGGPDDGFVPTSHHIPYGPFIALGALEYLFFGPVIFGALQALLGQT